MNLRSNRVIRFQKLLAELLKINNKPDREHVRAYLSREGTVLESWLTRRIPEELKRYRPHAILEAFEYILDSSIDDYEEV